MDCGAYRNGENYVIRIRGNEHLVTKDEWEEFNHHLRMIDTGVQESMSEDYNSLPEPIPFSERLSNLAATLGIKRKPIGIVRRI